MLAYLDTAIGIAVVMLGVSLIIMVLTQVVSAALSYRGSNLLWGLETLLGKIDPRLTNLTTYANEVATAILKNPLVSDSVLSNSGGGWIVRTLRWVSSLAPPALTKFQLASAIRSDELVSILSHMVQNPTLLEKVPAAQQAAVAGDIASLLGRANPTAARQAVFLRAAAAAIGPIANAVPIVEDAVDAARKEAGKLESWFDSTMDRVSQRFAMHIRIWTIIFAFVTAGVMQLDALKLVNDLYTSSDMRASFVSIAGSMNQVAQNLLPEGARTPGAVTATMTNLFTSATRKALADHPDVKATAVPVEIKSRAEGESWIHSSVPEAQQQPVFDSYNTAVDNALNDFMQKNRKSAEEIRDILQKGGIRLIQRPWSLAGLWGHLWGILISGALLSLGPPFWFNALKALMNLRPTLAQKEKQEQQQKSS